MGKLIHEGHVGMAGEHGVEVHLLERGAPVGQPGPRDDLKVVDLLGRVRAAVGLDERDDHVGAALAAAVTLVEHRERLAYAGGRAEVDPELPAAAGHAG
jgi:hypothetical protein